MEEMPAGFRFYPTEEELVCFYLHKKLEEKKMSNINRVIPLLDIYSFEPWQLPKLCGELCHGDPEQWFFFVPRQRREARGGKPSRTTASGYWKATGSPSYVYSAAAKVIGIKKSMVFYRGKAPIGRKTKWKMNEYKAIKHDSSTSIPELRHELSLCRIYVVSGSYRAFDRRPIAVEMSSSSREITRIPHENDDKLVEVCTNETATTLMEETSCSSESNSFSEKNCSWEKINCLKNLMEWENM